MKKDSMNPEFRMIPKSVNEYRSWDQADRVYTGETRGFSCKGLSGLGFSRHEWNNIKDLKEGTVIRDITDNTQPTGPIERTLEYQAPFTRCDWEEDYRVAWEGF